MKINLNINPFLIKLKIIQINNLLLKGAMMNIVRTLVSVLLGFIFLASSLFSLQTMAATSSSHMIPFQARLHDENGSVLTDGVYQIQTRIYASETGGDDQWTETHSHVSVINGYVNLLLGGITAITDANVQFSAREYYLGIVIGRYHTDGENVDISAELFPRHQLVPSFHAVTASDSARLGGVDADQFAQHSDVVREVGVVADDLANFKSNNFKQESVSFSNGTSETLLSAKNADFLDGKTAADFMPSDGLGTIEGYFKTIDGKVQLDSSIVTVTKATEAVSAVSAATAINSKYLGSTGGTYTPDYFRNATNLKTGTVPVARLPAATNAIKGIVQKTSLLNNTKTASWSDPNTGLLLTWVTSKSEATVSLLKNYSKIYFKGEVTHMCKAWDTTVSSNSVKFSVDRNYEDGPYDPCIIFIMGVE
jgi:hypothetical protein